MFYKDHHSFHSFFWIFLNFLKSEVKIHKIKRYKCSVWPWKVWFVLFSVCFDHLKSFRSTCQSNYRTSFNKESCSKIVFWSAPSLYKKPILFMSNFRANLWSFRLRGKFIYKFRGYKQIFSQLQKFALLKKSQYWENGEKRLGKTETFIDFCPSLRRKSNDF